MSICGEHVLANGRKYRLVDCGQYHKPDEGLCSGGIHITSYDPRYDMWVYIDNAPDEECAAAFLRAAARLSPL